eukprot:Tbor_TRINITY_DN2033_c0_g1::TRINITY_DN2033_c0_g1_i1::g.12084::m.12084
MAHQHSLSGNVRRSLICCPFGKIPPSLIKRVSPPQKTQITLQPPLPKCYIQPSDTNRAVEYQESIRQLYYSSSPSSPAHISSPSVHTLSTASDNICHIQDHNATQDRVSSTGKESILNPRCHQSQYQSLVLRRVKALHDKVTSVLSSVAMIPMSTGRDEYTAVVCGVVTDMTNSSPYHTLPSAQLPLSSLFCSVGVNHFIHKRANFRDAFPTSSGCEDKTRSLCNSRKYFSHCEERSAGSSFTLPGILKGCAEQNAIGAFAASGSLPYNAISSLYLCGRRGRSISSTECGTGGEQTVSRLRDVQYHCESTTNTLSAPSISHCDDTEASCDPTVLDSVLPCMTCWGLLRMIYWEKLCRVRAIHSNINHFKTNASSYRDGVPSTCTEKANYDNTATKGSYPSYAPTNHMEYVCGNNSRKEVYGSSARSLLTVYLSITSRDLLLIERWQRWTAPTHTITTTETDMVSTFRTSSAFSSVHDFQIPSSPTSSLVIPSESKPPSDMWVPPSHLRKAFHHSNVTSILVGNHHHNCRGCITSNMNVKINGENTSSDDDHDYGHKVTTDDCFQSAITEDEAQPYIVFVVNSGE